MADVTDLDEARKKKKAKAGDKTSAGEFAHNIVLKMLRDPLAPRGWPEFPKRFHVGRDEAGRRSILEEVPGRVVAYRVEDAVSDAISQYCARELMAVPEAMITAKQASQIRDLWLSLAPSLPDQAFPLAELSADGLAFKRLAFDAPVHRGEQGEVVVPDVPPTLESFLRRCSEPDAVAAFIGSLFYPEADRQQYLYLYGAGNDGKGALLRFLYDLLGPAAVALQPRQGGDRFWNMKIFGKRLVLFTDCEDFRFFASPDFKSLTGNDAIYFEPKGEPGFSAVPSCKLVAASNFKPNISSQTSDLRRLIYVEVDPIPKGEVVPHFEKRLMTEAPLIVAYCKAIYERMCFPDHRAIDVAPAHDVAADAEDSFISIFNRYFEPCAAEGWVPGHVVVAALGREGIRRGPEVAKLKAAWSRQFGVLVKRAAEGIRYYGMKTHCSPDAGRS